MQDGRTNQLPGARLLPLSSLKGYELSQLPKDALAGLVIAALSIPIAMGYASIAGLPPVYGIYSSIIAPLVYALVTGTRRIVFGMDSAASAMTGSIIASIGIVLGSQQAVNVMPPLTLVVAGFLLLFSALRAGRIIRLIPTPVMHGFIAGISLSVILTQAPSLIGVQVSMSGSVTRKLSALVGVLPQANMTTLLLSIACIGMLAMLKQLFPKAPRALMVLAVAALFTALFSLQDHGVQTLESIASGIPSPTIPSVGALDILQLVGGGFAIAVVVTFESLLCLETFAIKAGIRPNGSRELASFGIANGVLGIFGFPPCSASISRSAAGISAGSTSQVAAIISSLAVAIAAAFLAPVMTILPSAALSAIVVMALVEVCDFHKIARYARHMKAEFGIFLISATAVFAFGAIPGIITGFVMSLAFMTFRRLYEPGEAPLGIVPHGKYAKSKDDDSTYDEFDYAVFKMSGRIHFLNIDSTIDKLLAEINADTQAVIIKMSRVTSLDTTATDKLLQLLEMLHARNIEVKIVRKVRPTNDRYTRFELKTLMRNIKFYPNVRTALRSLSNDDESGQDPQGAAAWSAEARQQLKKRNTCMTPAILENEALQLTLTDEAEVVDGARTYVIVNGRIVYAQSGTQLGFEMIARKDGPKPGASEPFSFLVFTWGKDNQLLAEYDDGEWDWGCDKDTLEGAVEAVRNLRKSLRKDGKD